MSDEPYVFPDVDALMIDYLSNYFDGQGISFGVELPDDLDQRLPFVLISRLSGGPRILEVLDDAREDIEVRASTREVAHDTIQAVLAALTVMWRETFPSAIIYRTDLESSPGWVPDPITRQPRFIATVSVRNRPKR